MTCRHAALCAALLVLAASPTVALDKSEAIDTNRPSFTASPIVVPRSSVQFENGTLYQHFQHGKNYFDIPETQIRVGLTKRTEFQMFAPIFVLMHQGQTTTAGVSDLTEVGFKQQLGPFKRLQISCAASVNIPTGSKIISGSGVQPVFRVPYSLALTKNWCIGGMQSLLLLDCGRDVGYQPFVLLSRALGEKAFAFAEYAGFFTRHNQSLSIAHFGAVYKAHRNHQVDIQFGFGLNKNSPAALVGLGYSYRFDKLNW